MITDLCKIYVTDVGKYQKNIDQVPHLLLSVFLAFFPKFILI